MLASLCKAEPNVCWSSCFPDTQARRCAVRRPIRQALCVEGLSEIRGHYTHTLTLAVVRSPRGALRRAAEGATLWSGVRGDDR